MKLVSFVSQERPGYGVVKGGGVIDLGSRLVDQPTLRAMLSAGGLAEAQKIAREAAPDMEFDGLELETGGQRCLLIRIEIVRQA